MPVPASEFALPPVAERFCRYARVYTTSDFDSAAVPTTERQKDLGLLLVNELRAIGATSVEMDDEGYVYATLPSPLAPEAAARLPALGLCAHMDTSPDAPGENVTPLIHPDYNGGRIELPGAPEVDLSPATSPPLADAIGHDLITSDGTTLLGSDDKAGVAVLVQLAADLVASEADAVARGEGPAPRPTIQLLFTPDEEVGRGTDHLDLERWGAEVAYTLDGSGVDSLNVETFNAAEAIVTFHGVGVHPGYARGILVNALRVAADFIASCPAHEAPETTDGRGGYLHPHTASGDVVRAEVRVLLRDFDGSGMDAKRSLVRELASGAAQRHPGSRAEVDIRESYRNMLAYIEDVDPRAVSVAQEAAREMGMDLALEPVRGGTDGARLSEKGVPTPNVFTGGHEFHSVREWNTVQNLERSLAYTHALVRAWGRQ
ncbi:peptidase T [Rubricoccus marinus]|uniref:Peptidase T n=1 Tax=Rubricoccus marinus TaxID=716817 RepID=A0A259TWZ7_9BACT|nr:peptidase T [Rubricoccus marinus]